MSKKSLPRQSAAAAHMFNPSAASLAAEIDRSTDSEAVLKQAFMDAQIHRDWRRVAAIENSLKRVGDRTLARHLGNVATRAQVVSKLDSGLFAKRIPEGYEYGLAWLVCMVFVRTDPDYETALQIGESFSDRVAQVGGYGIDWGPAALVVPPLAFGGTTRLHMTQAADRGDEEAIYRIHDMAFEMVAREVEASRGREEAHAVGYVVFGIVVTGSNAPLIDLFDEAQWCPGFDIEDVGPRLIEHLAAAAAQYEGETFINPQVMAANVAHDFARSMTTEQTIHGIVHDVVSKRMGGDLHGAHVRITKLVPTSLPYMDQLLVSFFGRSNLLYQTYRMPRTGRSLEEDAERIAGMCRSRGIQDVRFVDLARPIGANDAPGYTVDLEGNLVDGMTAAIGDAAQLIRAPHWGDLHDLSTPGLEGSGKLPAIMAIEKAGALRILGEHYTQETWARVKVALSRHGDPSKLICDELERCWTRSADDLSWLLTNSRQMLLPSREVALAAQFKLASGTTVKVTPSLLTILASTDIGGECPAMYVRPGIEMMYLVLRTPCAAFDNPESDEARVFIDGVLVQRTNDGDGNELLLDVFLTTGRDADLPATMPDVVSLRLQWDDTLTLGDLRSQVKKQDEDLLQALDLYAGVMLYMNSRDARVVKRDDRAAAAAVISGLNRKKRRKEHYVALNSAVDGVVVGPELAPVGVREVLGEHGGAGVAPHYRRGFVRFGQRVGKGRSQTRPVFIPPVLVNANKLLGDLASKTYRVG